MNWTSKYYRTADLIEAAEGATSVTQITERLARREWHICERQVERDLGDLAEVGILIQFVNGRYRVKKASTYRPLA